MSRYRLQPTAAQETALLEHCSHARFVWNLAVEQHQHGTLETYGPASRRIDRSGNEYVHRKRRPVRRPPGFAEQCRQLTEARAEYEWLRAGSVNVQQQALRDFNQAMANFFGGTHGRPTWRKAGVHEGFRITDTCRVERLNRGWGRVAVPKIGWVRFRWSRAVPDGVKSYRVTRDRAGRWHIAFASVPEPIEAPGTGEIVGVDRGVAVSAATSTGETLTAPGLSEHERRRLVRLERKLARAKRGSNRRRRVKTQIAKLKARETDRRKDWVEKTSTNLARQFDVIAVEDLNIAAMTRSARGTVEQPGRNVRQKAGLNRGILAGGWGQLVQRLEHKAPGRIVKVNPAYTSLTCNACMHRARESRESQAVFRCVACGHQANADVNAARNIRDTASGRAVAAREGPRVAGPTHREPQPVLLPV